jgi:flavorubredoxin
MNAVVREGSCGGKKNLKKNVLVTYASKHGSTGRVAAAIGKELCIYELEK